MPVKICFITSCTTVGGAEQQLLYFLKKYDRNLFAPMIYTVLSADSSLNKGGRDILPDLRKLEIPFESFNLLNFKNPIKIFKMVVKVFEERWDIIQTFGLNVDLIVRSASLLRSKIKLISSIAGPENHRNNWLFRFDGLSSSLVALYRSNTQFGKNVYVKRGRIPRDKIIVIHNGIDADAFQRRSGINDRMRLRKEWNISKEEILVITVANLHRAKGHEDIIEVATILKDQMPKVRFAFCG